MTLAGSPGSTLHLRGLPRVVEAQSEAEWPGLVTSSRSLHLIPWLLPLPPLQTSPALGCQCKSQAAGGICAPHLLGLQTKKLHLPYTGLGRVSQRPLVRATATPC